MSGFIKHFNIPFIRIGGALKTKNELITNNNYLPTIPFEIQVKKQKLMFINSLLINSRSDIINFFNEIDSIVNIRKMMYQKHKLYSDTDEKLITNLFKPNNFVPIAGDYFRCFLYNDFPKLQSDCHNLVIKSCYKLLDDLQKYFEEKGEGKYSDTINNIVQNYQPKNNCKTLYDFLFDHNDKLFPQKEDKNNRDISLLFDIISNISFNEADLVDAIYSESLPPNIKFGNRFTHKITDMFQKLIENPLDCNRYNAFMTELTNLLVQRKSSLIESISKEMSNFEEEEHERLSEILKSKKLIAITATRAAQFKESLDKSNCRFLIVEEAAELSEPLLFSIIPKSIEQIIMIGDYNQLRPRVNQELSKDPFNHNISLFEKEVIFAKENNLPHLFTLSSQRRMHPEISSLVRSIFYNDNQSIEKLIDNNCILNLDKPNGLPNHLQFWLHHYNEKPPDDYERSYVNVEEAKICAYLFLMMLCRGYKSSEISILASYKGQKKQIIKEINNLIDEYYDDPD